jgi:hypothetical protein
LQTLRLAAHPIDNGHAVMVRIAHRLLALAVMALIVAPAAARAQQMPNPKEIAGIPLPVGDVAVGTVSVRVIRGSLANNIPDQAVELLVAGRARSEVTDAGGRAQFTGLEPGTEVTATATVGGERLQSQTFKVPASGGIRVLLVATDPDIEKRAEEDKRLAAGPAQPGAVVLGEQSRFVFEFADSSISVFNILQVSNTARVPVQPPQPVVFELPAGATGATVLQDSSTQAVAEGQLIRVNGPFAPGPTLIQFAYSMPYSGSRLTIAQKMPAALGRVIVLAQKGGEMRLESPQMTEQREMNAEGHTYIGTTLSFNFTNLPHAPTWPRNVALALAVVILAAGAWASRRASVAPAADKARERLEQRRERLFAELTSLEQQHRAGALEPARYAERRAELVSALERIYAEIDRRAA